MRFEKVRLFLAGMLTMALLLLATSMILNYFGISILPQGRLTNEVSQRTRVMEQLIDKYYWKDADKEKMASTALKAMVESLGDKYSTYYTPEEYQTNLADVKGVFYGIGATIHTKGKQHLIVDVFDGSPAKTAGLKAGDSIEKIDGVATKDMTLSEITGKIHGDKDTVVKLTILRGGKTKEINVTRGEVKTTSVYEKKLENEVGYILVTEFNNESPEQFSKAIESLEKQGMKKLVIDLRNNGGGSLTAVTQMLNRMLSKGEMFQIRGKGEDEIFTSDDKEHFDKPCSILINGHSASASEVFAGAMQDRKAAKLIGEKSFGKGIVQSIYPLSRGSNNGALKITTARYYLPSGRCIHEIGLTPDVKVTDTIGDGKYSMEKDAQLQKAIEILK